MKAFVFDVDGVLCDRNEPIDRDFQVWFKDWAKGKEIYFITGSERYRTSEQIGRELLNLAKIGFHCLGNSIWVDDKEYLVNQFELKKEEYDWLDDRLNSSDFYIKTGNHFEFRKGSVNFSIVGKNATREQRSLYVQYDRLHEERLTIVKEFKKQFIRLDAFLGGDVSIDICLRGADKSQCYKLMHNKSLYFFGDRCYPYGIDEPFSKLCQGNSLRAFQIDDGYKQTWNILKTL